MENKLSLVIAIVNSGFAEMVMDIARAAGVRGGTITHCRGTSNESMAKKYGVYVTPDKEMIWMVTNKDIADAVLKGVYEKVSDADPGKCFVFTLPVENAVGVTLQAPENKTE